MTARTSMATLITRLRLIINDSAGAPQQFSEDELQDFLDAHVQKYDQCELIEVPTVNATTKVTEYLAYFARVGGWESSPTIQDKDLVTVTPSASDLIYGRWTLSATKDPPLYITGTAHDVWAAAADAMEIWASRFAQGYDAINERYTPPRARVAEIYIKLAERFRAQAWPSITTVRQE